MSAVRGEADMRLARNGANDPSATLTAVAGHQKIVYLKSAAAGIRLPSLSQNQGAAMSAAQVETNKATIRQLVDAHNRQDASGAAACFASTGTNHGRVVGPSGMERVYGNLYTVFPDYHW